MKILILFLGVILGYLITSFISPKKDGRKGKFKSWKFTIGNYVIHLHHWFIASIILMVFLFFNLDNNLILGFIAGVVVQDFTYKGFYKLVYKRKDED